MKIMGKGGEGDRRGKARRGKEGYGLPLTQIP